MNWESCDGSKGRIGTSIWVPSPRSTRATNLIRRFVDDDVDVYDMNDVLWAMCTRVDPVKDMDLIRRAWSGPLDPIIPKDQKGFSSRAIIEATRPYEWMKDFPMASAASTELKEKIIEKYD